MPVITNADLSALTKSLAGTSFEDRRDTAIVRLFLNTRARLEEMAQLQLDVVSLQHRELYVLGKGRKGRVLPLGAKAVEGPRSGICGFVHATSTTTYRGCGLVPRVG